MSKNLQNFTILSKFASKNAKIPFNHYLFGKSIHSLPILTKNDWKNSVL